MCKQRMRLGCNRSKIGTAYRSTFSAPCLDLQVPRLPPGGSLGTPKILGTSPKFFQDRYVYTVITDNAVLKNCQYGAKILGCRANFLVRVNGNGNGIYIPHFLYVYIQMRFTFNHPTHES